jgi:hypothetical protein
MRDYPATGDRARHARKKLAPFSGLHMTPPEWLHVTTLVDGPADAFTNGQMAHTIRHAQADLAAVAPITAQLGKILYHPEAIMLAVSPAAAVYPLRDAARSATEQATGSPVTSASWTQHVTVCYSTEKQSAAPLISALGLPEQHVTISALSLVIQDGPERDWNWSTVGVAKPGPSSVPVPHDSSPAQRSEPQPSTLD